jgi:hypothetical protein
MGRKGFGVVECSLCGTLVQSEPVYFQIVARIKTLKHSRRMQTLATLCKECFDRR